jgi:hypothetical protein
VTPLRLDLTDYKLAEQLRSHFGSSDPKGYVEVAAAS